MSWKNTLTDQKENLIFTDIPDARSGRILHIKIFRMNMSHFEKEFFGFFIVKNGTLNLSIVLGPYRA